MISAGLQAFPMHKDAPEVFSTSMQGVGETLDPTFAQLFAHSQRKDEAFVQHPELKNNLATHEKRINKGFLNEEALEALRGWAQSLSEFESFFQDFDWETAVIITEKALSENEGGILSSGDLASYMDGADLSIEEMVEMAITEGLNAEKPFGFTKETKKVIVPFLMALIDAPVEKEGMQKVTPQQLARYIQQWYLGGQEIESENHRVVSGRKEETGKGTVSDFHRHHFEPLQTATKMEMGPPNMNHGSAPSSVFVFNEKMGMQALNQGEQMKIHIGGQMTEHARAMAFMKQFHQALGKGHLRSDGEGRQQLTIKLYPESLGRLDVQMTRENGALQARLVTTTAIARELLEAQLPNLRHAFHQQQLPVERIVVDETHSQVDDGRREGEDSEEEGSSASEDDSGEDGGSEQLPSFEEWLHATLNQKV